MNCATAFLKYLSKWVLDNCSEEMKFVEKRIDNTCSNRLQQIITASPEMLTYHEAVEILRKVPNPNEHLILTSAIVIFLLKEKIIIFHFNAN